MGGWVDATGENAGETRGTDGVGDILSDVPVSEDEVEAERRRRREEVDVVGR